MLLARITELGQSRVVRGNCGCILNMARPAVWRLYMGVRRVARVDGLTARHQHRTDLLPLFCVLGPTGGCKLACRDRIMVR